MSPTPSRRAVLALAPVVGALSPCPVLAADPDAALVALAAQYEALAADCEAVAAQLDTLAVALPPWPEALRAKPRDWFTSTLSGVGSPLGRDVAARWREAFANGLYRSCMTSGQAEAFEARGREVIAAAEAHEAATQAAKVASGYQPLADRLEALGRDHYATERRIMETPAAGLTGLRVKARIALAAMGDPDGTYEDAAARAVLADLVREAHAPT